MPQNPLLFLPTAKKRKKKKRVPFVRVQYIATEKATMVFITKPKLPLLFLFLSTLFLSTSLSSTLADDYYDCAVCLFTTTPEYCRDRFGCPYLRSQGSDNCMQRCEMKMSETWQKDQCKTQCRQQGVYRYQVQEKQQQYKQQCEQACQGQGQQCQEVCQETLRQVYQCYDKCLKQGQPQERCQQMCLRQLEQGQGIKMVVN